MFIISFSQECDKVFIASLDPVDLLGVVAVYLWFLADGVAEGQQGERVLVVGQVEELADFLHAVRDGGKRPS